MIVQNTVRCSTIVHSWIDRFYSLFLGVVYFSDAVNNAAYLCEQFYCASPEVEISELNG